MKSSRNKISSSPRSSGNTKQDSNCENCNTKFNLLHRKHDCRQCGGVFCSACTQNLVLMPTSGVPVRVCDACREEHEAKLQEKTEARKDRIAGRDHKFEKDDDELLVEFLGPDAAAKIINSAKLPAGKERRKAREVEQVNLVEELLESRWERGRKGAAVKVENVSAPKMSQDPAMAAKLREEAKKLREKAALYRKEGLSDASRRQLKKAKELEKEADEFDPPPVPVVAKLNERQKEKKEGVEEKGGSASGAKVREVKGGKSKGEEDDFLADLKELGWNDEKPKVGIMLGGSASDGGVGGGLQGRVLEHKKRALLFKREGKLTEAVQELKQAKILEKQVEDEALLGEDGGSGDEEEEFDFPKIDDMDWNQVQKANKVADFGGGVGGFELDLSKIAKFGEDDEDVEVDDSDMNDPELTSMLREVGWEGGGREGERAGGGKEVVAVKKERPLPSQQMALQAAAVNVVSKKKSMEQEAMELKRNALMLKREGRVTEAVQELKKAKMIEQKLEEMEVGGGEEEEEDDDLFISAADLGGFDKGHGGAALDMKAVEKMAMFEEGEEDDVNVQVTEDDEKDPEMKAALKAMGWIEEAPVRAAVTSQSQSESKVNVVNSPKSEAEYREKILEHKKAALSLKREGDLGGAARELKKSKVLESELNEFLAKQNDVEDENSDVEVDEDDEENPEFAAALKNMGWEEEKKAEILPSVSPPPSVPLTIKSSSTSVTSSLSATADSAVFGSNFSAQMSSEEIQKLVREHKLKALALKREGKIAEATFEFRQAKNLELKLQDGFASSAALAAPDGLQVGGSVLTPEKKNDGTAEKKVPDVGKSGKTEENDPFAGEYGEIGVPVDMGRLNLPHPSSFGKFASKEGLKSKESGVGEQTKVRKEEERRSGGVEDEGEGEEEEEEEEDDVFDEDMRAALIRMGLPPPPPKVPKVQDKSPAFERKEKEQPLRPQRESADTETGQLQREQTEQREKERMTDNAEGGTDRKSLNLNREERDAKERASEGREGGESIPQMETDIMAFKRRALTLKREGDIVGAREELAKAKLLEGKVAALKSGLNPETAPSLSSNESQKDVSKLTSIGTHQAATLTGAGRTDVKKVEEKGSEKSRGGENMEEEEEDDVFDDDLRAALSRIGVAPPPPRKLSQPAALQDVSKKQVPPPATLLASDEKEKQQRLQRESAEREGEQREGERATGSAEVGFDQKPLTLNREERDTTLPATEERDGGGSIPQMEADIMAFKRRALALKREGDIVGAREELAKARLLEGKVVAWKSGLNPETAPSLSSNEKPKDASFLTSGVTQQAPTLMVSGTDHSGSFESDKLRVLSSENPSINSHKKEGYLDSFGSPPDLMRNVDDQVKQESGVSVSTTQAENVDNRPTGEGEREQKDLVTQPSEIPIAERILAHKRKALAFKKEGNLEEAMKELKAAKLLEVQGQGGGPSRKVLSEESSGNSGSEAGLGTAKVTEEKSSLSQISTSNPAKLGPSGSAAPTPVRSAAKLPPPPSFLFENDDDDDDGLDAQLMANLRSLGLGGGGGGGGGRGGGAGSVRNSSTVSSKNQPANTQPVSQKQAAGGGRGTAKVGPSGSAASAPVKPAAKLPPPPSFLFENDDDDDDGFDAQLMANLRSLGLGGGGGGGGGGAGSVRSGSTVSSKNQPANTQPVPQKQAAGPASKGQANPGVTPVAPTEPEGAKAGVGVADRQSLEGQIRAEKVKALQFKKAGNSAEALEALRAAKRLELQLNSLG